MIFEVVVGGLLVLAEEMGNGGRYPVCIWGGVVVDVVALVVIDVGVEVVVVPVVVIGAVAGVFIGVNVAKSTSEKSTKMLHITCEVSSVIKSYVTSIQTTNIDSTTCMFMIAHAIECATKHLALCPPDTRRIYWTPK